MIKNVYKTTDMRWLSKQIKTCKNMSAYIKFIRTSCSTENFILISLECYVLYAYETDNEI